MGTSEDSGALSVEAALQAIRDAVGERGIVPAEEGGDLLTDWRRLLQGRVDAIVKPASTEEVSAVVKAAAAARMAIVPQGGNTGMMGGATAVVDGPAILLNLSRMNRVRDVDVANYTMTVEAGCVLQQIQETAREHDRLFPLSLGAEGTCQIGGNIATNAGGILTIRYGNTRDLVLGLEVVLPDGTIWNGLRRLRKDNTGYDLKQAFIGSEGTLGVITAAVLKLYPVPTQTQTALVALPDPAASIALLSRMRGQVGDVLTAFELMERTGFDLAATHLDGADDPLEEPSPWYGLIEISAGASAGDLQALTESALEGAFEAGEITDAVLASSESQRQALWFLREAVVEGERLEGGSLKHDISVPVSAVADFIATAHERIRAALPEVRFNAFGHVGDGNLHYNLVPPAGSSFGDRRAEMSRIVHDTVIEFGGSISAEHGIGRLKTEMMPEVKSHVDLAMMRVWKRGFDPHGIMNPGAIMDFSDPA